MNQIKGFDENSFLSNFYPSIIYPNHIKYPTVEHAFQAQKTMDSTARELIRLCETPGRAKRLGKKVQLRKDWEEVKLNIMLNLLRMKFSCQNNELRLKLIETNDAEIIEENYWNDWGICKGIGENNLGKLLMKVRNEINNGIEHRNKEWVDK